MKIILFDGICNFCDSTVQLIIKLDKNSIFKFASQQSEIGIKILSEYHYMNDTIDTIIFINEDKIYIKSDAALKICSLLTGYPRLFLIFRILPRFVRDFLYDIFAKNRYKLFGQKNECMIPDDSIKNRFLQ